MNEIENPVSEDLLRVGRLCQLVIDRIEAVPADTEWLFDYNLPDLKEAINVVLDEEG